MNILPKKRWHVRTKDNIARVRRDEANHREQEEKRLEKLKFAESEARINFLRRQSGLPERQTEPDTEAKVTPSTSGGHIDLFADFKSHVKASNKDLEKEQKEEREKYEKQIGYLTYLGQDTNEALKLRSWYEVAPARSKHFVDTTSVSEKDLKAKFTSDPLTLINALLPKEKQKEASSHPQTKSTIELSLNSGADREISLDSNSKHRHKKNKKEKKSKKHKKNKKSYKKEKRAREKQELESQKQQKSDLLAQLRKERLQREKVERLRQDELLKPREELVVDLENKSSATPRIVQKYNSQFNPELAKQNIS